MTTILQRFSVDYEFPVCFTRDLFDPANPTFLETVARGEPDKRHRVLFVVDDNVAAATPGLVDKIEAYCRYHREHLQMLGEVGRVPGGEVAKNDLDHVFKLVEQVNTHGIDRQSYLVVIGGGAVLDMGCFAAGISHRGIRHIRVPTTVLSQNDSGVGVKNGVNLFGKKNFIGTFVPPYAVINDLEFIETLEHRDKIAGVAEAVKVAAIRDRDFFDFLEANVSRLARADKEVMAYQIRRSAELHLEHIRTSGDPFEFGSSRPLDFGHWAAHKLESMTEHRLRHGEAVALGMALDTIYSVKVGYLPAGQGERMLDLLEGIGFALWDEAMDERDVQGNYLVLNGIREFQEHLGGLLHVTLLRGELGQRFEVNEMDLEQLKASIAELQARYGIRGGRGKLTAASLAI